MSRNGTGRAALTACALLCATALAPASAARRGRRPAPAPIFTEEVSPTSIELGATATLRIVAVTPGPARLHPPDLLDFDIVATEGGDEETGSDAGTLHRQVLILTLSPKRAGLFRIPSAQLDYAGKSLVARRPELRVVDPATQPPGGAADRAPEPAREEASESASPQPSGPPSDPLAAVHPAHKNLVLAAVVDQPRPFVGQQVTYSVYLLARTPISAVDKLEMPRMDGFWTQELEAPRQLTADARLYDGDPYRIYLLRRWALFPLKEGKIELGAAHAEVQTGYGLVGSDGPALRRSLPVVLEVQPLPATGRPAGFDEGNVGSWSLSAAIDPPAVSAGQPVELRITASGTGNLRGLRLPKLPAVDGLRAYTPNVVDREQVQSGRVGGARTFEQLLVAERTGEFEIPALALDIFDPEARAYRTLHTQPLRLAVGAAAPGASAEAGGGARNQLADSGLRPIRLHLSLQRSPRAPWQQLWFWAALAAAPILLSLSVGGRMAFRSWANSSEAMRARRAHKLAGRAIAAALRAPEADAAVQIHRALNLFLEQRFLLRAAALGRTELVRALRARGVGRAGVDALLGAFETCDRARFAPGGGPDSAKIAQLAQQALDRLERDAESDR